MNDLSSRFTVLLDTCVLYGATKRDFLLRLARHEFYTLKWSRGILIELREKLLEAGYTIADLDQMERDFHLHNRDAQVHGFERLIPCMGLNDSEDNHVLAAGIRARVNVIVSDDRVFEDLDEDYDIEIQNLDEFLSFTIELNMDKAMSIFEAMCSDYGKSVDEMITIYDRSRLTKTVEMMRKYYS